jgi:hypothetical protein
MWSYLQSEDHHLAMDTGCNRLAVVAREASADGVMNRLIRC